jgi:hypothetical protein
MAFADQSEYRHTQIGEISEGGIVVLGGSGQICRVSLRYESYHSLPCSGQQHSIPISKVCLILGFVHVPPFASLKLVVCPAVFRVTEVCVPGYTCPVNLEPLYPKLRGSVFQETTQPRIITGPRNQCTGSVFTRTSIAWGLSRSAFEDARMPDLSDPLVRSRAHCLEAARSRVRIIG